MSQEHEYTISQINRGEYSQRDVERLVNQNRRDLEQHMQDLVNAEAQRLQNAYEHSLSSVRGEIRGLRSDVERRISQIKERIDCETKLRNALANRLETLDKDYQRYKIRTDERLNYESQQRNLLKTKVDRVEEDLTDFRGEVDSRLELERRSREFGEQNLNGRINQERAQREALAEDLNRLNKRIIQERQSINKAIKVIDGNILKMNQYATQNRSLINTLSRRANALEQKYEMDLQQRKMERDYRANDAQAMLRLVEDSLGILEKDNLAMVGLADRLERLKSKLKEVKPLLVQQHQSQAIFAILYDILDKAATLESDFMKRTTEFDQTREMLKLNMDRIKFRLDCLSKDKDIMAFFGQSIDAMNIDFQRIGSDRATLDNLSGRDFSRILASYDALVKEAIRMDDKLSDFMANIETTFRKVKQRNVVVQKVIESLADVWGTTFEVEHHYSISDDPASSLVLQTKRPHQKNVTVQVDLDGRMQTSFTGYFGMECVKDVAAFQEKILNENSLVVEVASAIDHPDAPNPSGVDMGRKGPVVYIAPAKSIAEASIKKERS